MKDFVPYNEAIKLKELGFDEECFKYYTDTGELYLSNLYGIHAPTFSQAFRFFRKKHDLFSCVELRLSFPIRYYFIIDEIGNGDFVYHTEDDTILYDKYEDAEIACLRLLIEIAKKNL